MEVEIIRLFGLIGEKGILENIVLKLYFINTLPSNMV